MIRKEVPYWEDRPFVLARIAQQEEHIADIEGRDLGEDRKKELLDSAQFIKDKFVAYLDNIDCV